MKIGIDVGGSHIALGIVEDDGSILLKKSKDYEVLENNMSSIVIESIQKLVEEMLEEKKLKIEDFEMMGITFPGTVSKGIVVKAENLGIENLKVEEELSKVFPIPILLENDAKCAAIAEKNFGSLKKYSDCLFIIMGTGVGGAAFMDGKLLKPIRYSGFEVGHMVIKQEGEYCNCGRNGCFEVYGSMKRFKEKLKEEFNLESIDGLLVENFMRANLENKKLNEMIDEYISDITIGLANLINIFEPEAISIGGSFAFYEDLLVPRLIRKLDQKKELYNKDKIPDILVAELKNDAGIIGAAMLS